MFQTKLQEACKPDKKELGMTEGTRCLLILHSSNADGIRHFHRLHTLDRPI